MGAADDDLRARLRATDLSTTTLDTLQSTVTELCCRYAADDAILLRTESLAWLTVVRAACHAASGPASGGLLTAAGRLALLVGCLDHDLGQRTAAETTRIMAARLAHDAGDLDTVGWSHEMAAWFALTDHRWCDVVVAAQAGRHLGGTGSVRAQLAAQEAKARARLGERDEVRRLLDTGQTILDQLPPPRQPGDHFVVEPAKWDLFAMDAYRVVGDDRLAAHHATRVLADARPTDAPMRWAEAELTLAVVAARGGDHPHAVQIGLAALRHHRRSLPSLLMVVDELRVALRPSRRATTEFDEGLASCVGRWLPG